jgi:hypothetical protein
LMKIDKGFPSLVCPRALFGSLLKACCWWLLLCFKLGFYVYGT